MKRKWIIFAILILAAGMFVLVSCGRNDEKSHHAGEHPSQHEKEHPAAPAEKPESGAAAEEQAEIELVGNTTCPVIEGNPVKEGLYVDVKGKRINVCCQSCVQAIKADPDKYLKKLK